MPKAGNKEHTKQYRVYYEDTDAGGVMYHAGYFKFAERARTEMFRDLGFGQLQMREKMGILFVVRFAEAEYMKPARLDDMLTLHTSIEKRSRTSIILKQVFKKESEDICVVRVVVVCIKENFKPTSIPKQVQDVLENYA